MLNVSVDVHFSFIVVKKHTNDMCSVFWLPTATFADWPPVGRDLCACESCWVSQLRGRDASLSLCGFLAPKITPWFPAALPAFDSVLWYFRLSNHGECMHSIKEYIKLNRSAVCSSDFLYVLSWLCCGAPRTVYF